MSERTNIHFMDFNSIAANVYLHYGGEDVPDLLDEFFTEILNKIPKDTRFDDPEYLAARFVVFMSKKYSTRTSPLDFVGVGVMTRDAADTQYIVTVEQTTKNSKPEVSIKKLYE